MAENKQYVGFMMGSEHYGVDIMAVEEIIRPIDITPVPRAPSGRRSSHSPRRH